MAKSGPVLAELITEHAGTLGACTVDRACVADDVSSIQQAIRRWTDDLGAVLVITTGGTGFSPRGSWSVWF